jgi:hypothetical protein
MTKPLTDKLSYGVIYAAYALVLQRVAVALDASIVNFSARVRASYDGDGHDEWLDFVVCWRRGSEHGTHVGTIRGRPTGGGPMDGLRACLFGGHYDLSASEAGADFDLRSGKL